MKTPFLKTCNLIDPLTSLSKGNRTLIWKNNLGQVSIDLEIDGKVLEFNVTPVQCAVIMRFQERETWCLAELSQAMKMCSFVLRKKLAFWRGQGVLRQVERAGGEERESMAQSGDDTQMDTGAVAEVYTLVKEAAKVNEAF